MKLVNRIFLFFGALSVISFVQFDAGGANCSNMTVADGSYCHSGLSKYCLPGCYCLGATGKDVSMTNNRLEKICTKKEKPTDEERVNMNTAGVYVCPNARQFSQQQAKSENDCVSLEYCNTEPSKGFYCKTKSEGNQQCPSGCWCEGGDRGKKAVGIMNPEETGYNTIPLKSWCGKPEGDRVHWVEGYLEDRGVHYCPDEFPLSDNGSSKKEDCYRKNSSKKFYFGIKHCYAGTYLRRNTPTTGSCDTCDAGFYCRGGDFVVSSQEDRGKTRCPDGYNSSRGADEITDCKDARGQSYVATSGGGNNNALDVKDVVRCEPGEYLDTLARAQCVQCEAGYYCQNGINRERCSGLRQYSNAGQAACSTCPAGRQANSTHTGCEAMTINMGSTDVAAQHEAFCLDGQSHSVSFLRGADDATGTMNPVNKCTGNTVTLPSSGFTRAGYQFDEWNCGNIGIRAAGATFSMPDANVTCTAQWTPVPAGTYTVSYTCGDGSGSAPVDNGSYAHNYSVTVKSNTCTAPSGKTFDIWSCNGTFVTPGNQFTITENTTCKAQWKNDTDQTVHCPQGGKYWNGNGCVDCPMGAYCPVNDDERHECENNTYSNTTGNEVCTACPVGETAINNHTDCTSNQTVTCGEGKYLPAGSSNCVQCPDGYGCSGGTFEIKNFNQGREQCMPDRVSCQNYSACCYCPDGSNPNDTYSGCVNSNGTVVLPEDPDDSCTTAGKYWDGDGCITCESGYFCPGNGQHYKCPFGGASTQNKASCILNLNETQMEYNKCWLRYWNNAAAYRKCLYGIDLATLLH